MTGFPDKTPEGAKSFAELSGEEAWRRFSRSLSGGSAGGALSTGNRVDVYFTGDEAFDAMREAIRGAERYVHLEMYIFKADTVGRSFAEVLMERAAAGVAVRVIFDGLGSIKANRKLFATMRKNGVDVREFRPLAPWRRRAGWLRRNHRKTLVVDGKVAFTGGMNLANAYSAKASGEPAWRDTAVRVEGPAARDCDVHFRETWNNLTREHLLPPEPWKKPGYAEGCPCVVIGSRGMKQRRAIRRLYSVHLGLAFREVQMTVPYFAPPHRLRRALYHARERGVEVRVLVSRDTDVPMADWVREGLYPDLLDHDIEVHEYTASVMHAKTMVVDRHVAVVGSANFDYVSVALNLELAVVVFDQRIAERVMAQFDEDLEGAHRLSHGWAATRPWWRRWMARVGAFLIRKL